MKKFALVLFSICLIMTLVGTAAAKPKWIDTLTLDYSTLPGPFEPHEVEGALAPGYKLYYDETVDYYLLFVLELDPLPDEGMYPFYLKTAPKGPYFKYMASRGVTADADAGSWQEQMWLIINGEAPMFYLRVGHSMFGDPELLYPSVVDGLLHDWDSPDNPLYDGVYPLRINGDYFVGTYHFIGYPELDGQPMKTMIKLFFANP
jgi:hypothetical protein